jgi:broad-specificity NMP kinase
MRVAITGAHGVGKSTLAEELSEVLAAPVLSTPGRTLAARGLPVNEDATGREPVGRLVVAIPV